MRILWIRAWTEPTHALRAALDDIGVSAIFMRVDIEPALHAAIARRDFEIAIVDRECGLSRELVETRFREQGVLAPVIDHEATATLVQRIEQAMLSHRIHVDA